MTYFDKYKLVKVKITWWDHKAKLIGRF